MGLLDKIKNEAAKSGASKGKFIYFRPDEKKRIRFLQEMMEALVDENPVKRDAMKLYITLQNVASTAAVLQINVAVVHAFRQLAGDIAFLLLGLDVVDESFLALEIEGYRVAFIRVVSHLEYGGARERLLGRILDTGSMDNAAVETDGDLLALQVHTLIFHVGLAKEVDLSACSVVDHRIVGRIVYGHFDAVFLLFVV